VGYRVVLDANVLYGFALCDTLLRMAERELFDIAWSERILDELARNLIDKRGLTRPQVDQRLAAMRAAFEDAAQDADAIEGLEPILTNDPKDRHVLAAAIVAGAEGIVSFDDHGFPAASLAPYDKQLRHPDDFLCSVFDMHEDATVQTIREQAAVLVRPPQALSDVLDALHLTGAPMFAGRLRRRLELPDRSTEVILAERRTRGLPVPGELDD
jgi:predicted nucleic acid-binding protein